MRHGGAASTAVHALVLAGCAADVPRQPPPVGTPPPATTGVSEPTAEASAAPAVRTETIAGAPTPAISATPPPGIYGAEVTVDLLPSEAGAPIWFTIGGGPPVVGASEVWSGPLVLPSGATIRAVTETAGGSATFVGTWLRSEASTAAFSSDLPVIVLWSETDAPEWKDAAYTPFSMSVFEPGATGRTAWPGAAALTSRAGLKIRGSSSAGYPKHPYRLETWAVEADTDADVALLGMAEEADWILGAPLDFDRALLRDPLVFALSNAIGRWAPQTRFAELFVAENREAVGLDDYVGVYVVTERIERDGDRVDIAPLLPTDVSEPELTGGYLFKEDRLGPEDVGFFAGTGGGVLAFQQPFVSVDPAESALAAEQQGYLVAQLDELGDALVSPGFVHPVTGRHYSAIIDVDAFIDHHILNVLAKNPDAFRLSGYFHKDREGPIAAGPVWDFDRTLGCSTDTRAEDPTWWDAQNVTPDCTAVFLHGFWAGLFADPAFRAAYWSRWQDLLDTSLSVASMNAVIDGFAAELEEAAVRNYLAWPDYPPRGGSHAAEVAALEAWLAARHAWIAGCLALPDPRSCAGA